MVYVDELRPCIPNVHWRFHESCHMVADTVEELHAFALRLYLKREWFQDKRLKHYDLNKTKREMALKLGAREISSRDMIRRFVHDGKV